MRREDDEIAVQRRSFWALAFVAAFVLTFVLVLIAYQETQRAACRQQFVILAEQDAPQPGKCSVERPEGLPKRY